MHLEIREMFWAGKQDPGLVHARTIACPATMAFQPAFQCHRGILLGHSIFIKIVY